MTRTSLPVSRNQRILIALFACFGRAWFAAPASAASVTISPASVNIAVGSPFTVTIDVASVTNLFGMAFDLMFDPARLSFVSGQNGTFLEQGAQTTVLTAVSPPGDLIVGYTRLAVNGVPTGVSGSGNVMVLTFQALAAGTTALTFQNNNLCDPSGSECNPIAATWSNGSVTVTSGTADTIAPIVTAFTIPAAASSLTVSITSFTATDNTSVTGYTVTESSTAPASSATSWTSTAPTSYAFSSAGSKTLYAWAKDATGNVSTSRSATVTITLADTQPPTVPANLSATAISASQINLSWTASTDNIV